MSLSVTVATDTGMGGGALGGELARATPTSRTMAVPATMMSARTAAVGHQMRCWKAGSLDMIFPF
ncbi:hypothetical protein FQZ97_948360 [compost metagenome]